MRLALTLNTASNWLGSTGINVRAPRFRSSAASRFSSSGRPQSALQMRASLCAIEAPFDQQASRSVED
jgi:hypothetical protein